MNDVKWEKTQHNIQRQPYECLLELNVRGTCAGAGILRLFLLQFYIYCSLHIFSHKIKRNENVHKWGDEKMKRFLKNEVTTLPLTRNISNKIKSFQ